MLAFGLWVRVHAESFLYSIDWVEKRITRLMSQKLG